MSHPIDEFTLTSKRTPAARGHLRKGVIFGAIVLTIGLWLAQFYAPQLLAQPLPLIDGPTGYDVYVDPLKSWSLAFPDSWHARTYLELRPSYRGMRASGIEITNIDHAFPDGSVETPFDPRLVAIAVGYSAGGGFMIYCRTDTKLPVNLKHSNQNLESYPDTSGGRVMELYKSFSKDGLPLFSIRAWIGSQAAREDIRRMEAIVGSINYRPTGNRRYGNFDCSEGVPPG